MIRLRIKIQYMYVVSYNIIGRILRHRARRIVVEIYEKAYALAEYRYKS
jgi:hypothetical protein